MHSHFEGILDLRNVHRFVLFEIGSFAQTLEYKLQELYSEADGYAVICGTVSFSGGMGTNCATIGVVMFHKRRSSM
jgi:hypothetical protein